MFNIVTFPRHSRWSILEMLSRVREVFFFQCQKGWESEASETACTDSHLWVISKVCGDTGCSCGNKCESLWGDDCLESLYLFFPRLCMCAFLRNWQILRTINERNLAKAFPFLFMCLGSYTAERWCLPLFPAFPWTVLHCRKLSKPIQFSQFEKSHSGTFSLSQEKSDQY